MIDPQHVTADQAADPRTPLQVLADVAARRPDLRAAVASNPAAYPALLEWLGSLGDPAVDAALRAREGGATGAGGATASDVRPHVGVSDRIAQYSALPGQVPATGATGFGPPPGGAVDATRPTDGGFVPLGPAGRGAATEDTAPYLPVPRPVPYTQPHGAYADVPGAPSSTAPHAYGAPPPYGAPQPWATPPKRSRKALWITLGVVGFLVVAGLGLLVAFAIGAAADAGYGSDPVLDALHDECAAGDMTACDDLYRDSPFFSEYERFGDTCGGRTEGVGWCVDELG